MDTALPETTRTFTAFVGHRCVACGTITEVLTELVSIDPEGLLVFEDQTGNQIDFDLRGSAEDAIARLPDHPLFAADFAKKAGPGRPRLGVVAREVTLLPRHWDWLEGQRGGISVALRALVEDAIKRGGTALRRCAECRRLSAFSCTITPSSVTSYPYGATPPVNRPSAARCCIAWPVLSLRTFLSHSLTLAKIVKQSFPPALRASICSATLSRAKRPDEKYFSNSSPKSRTSTVRFHGTGFLRGATSPNARHRARRASSLRRS